MIITIRGVYRLELMAKRFVPAVGGVSRISKKRNSHYRHAQNAGALTPLCFAS
jgi:hypothetical protein